MPLCQRRTPPRSLRELAREPSVGRCSLALPFGPGSPVLWVVPPWFQGWRGRKSQPTELRSRAEGTGNAAGWGEWGGRRAQVTVRPEGQGPGVRSWPLSGCGEAPARTTRRRPAFLALSPLRSGQPTATHPQPGPPRPRCEGASRLLWRGQLIGVTVPARSPCNTLRPAQTQIFPERSSASPPRLPACVFRSHHSESEPRLSPAH